MSRKNGPFSTSGPNNSSFLKLLQKTSIAQLLRQLAAPLCPLVNTQASDK
jgi:hypothetical protein